MKEETGGDVKRMYRIVISLHVFACACVDDEHVESVNTSQQALQGSTESIPQADEMQPPPSGPLHLPPSQGAPPQTPRTVEDRCPDEKPNRADWEELVREKALRKSMRAADVPASIEVAIPPASAEHLARQAHFLEVVQTEEARLWTMSEDDRQQAYSELKRRYLVEE
jgi:hypothetical protein